MANSCQNSTGPVNSRPTGLLGESLLFQANLSRYKRVHRSTLGLILLRVGFAAHFPGTAAAGLEVIRDDGAAFHCHLNMQAAFSMRSS